jgi:hypothetical protein
LHLALVDHGKRKGKFLPSAQRGYEFHNRDTLHQALSAAFSQGAHNLIENNDTRDERIAREVSFQARMIDRNNPLDF